MLKEFPGVAAEVGVVGQGEELEMVLGLKKFVGMDEAASQVTVFKGEKVKPG
jgi:hypothetical protein